MSKRIRLLIDNDLASSRVAPMWDVIETMREALEALDKGDYTIARSHLIVFSNLIEDLPIPLLKAFFAGQVVILADSLPEIRDHFRAQFDRALAQLPRRDAFHVVKATFNSSWAQRSRSGGAPTPSSRAFIRDLLDKFLVVAPTPLRQLLRVVNRLERVVSKQ